MSVVDAAKDEEFDAHVPLLIIGAGAAGLCAALAAKEAGVEAVVIERDAVPSGSTALSAGLHSGRRHALPARQGHRRRRRDCSPPTSSARRMARPSRPSSTPSRSGSGPLIEWLADRYGFPFDVVDNFNYPGHSALRMHGLPSPHRAGIDRPPARRRRGERYHHPQRSDAPSGCWRSRTAACAASKSSAADGAREHIGCGALVLACNGYGGNPRAGARASFRKWRTRFTSAIPAIAATPCSGARRWARNSRISPLIKAMGRSRRRTIF